MYVGATRCECGTLVCAGAGCTPECDPGDYCHDLTVGGCGSGTPVCERIPGACLDIYAPVCGCDGTTYGNDCYAGLAGVSVMSDGECGGDPPPPPPPMDECTTAADCESRNCMLCRTVDGPRRVCLPRGAVC
jgi:hypothetical protein